MKLKGIIPTGGRGTRMRPLTFSSNKHLIPVANKPLIFYPIETLADAGVKNIAITHNPGGQDYVKNLIGNGSKWGLKFTYVLQEEPKGLANIIEVCEDYLDGSPFVMHLGDNIFSEGIKNLVSHFNKKKPNGLVGMVRHPENTRLGVPYFDKDGRLIKYVEKPKSPPHDWAIPGIYFADHNLFKCFKGKDKIKPSKRGELEVSSPFQWLIDKGYHVDVQEIKGKWLDPGKIDDWLGANKYLLDLNTKSKIGSKLGKDVKIKGKVTIGKNCSIDKSIIRGPVSIGDNVTINQSIIDPHTSIYNDCTIIGSHISNSVLMRGVTIDKVKKIIDESMIGPDADIGQTKIYGDRLELLVSELSKVRI
jgi:glucose-1-phosphate thymidylyltransferase